MHNIVVIGNIMVDIIVSLGKSIKVNNLIPGMSVNVENITISHGGVGNIATALALLGNIVYLIGKCGNDYFGKEYVKELIKWKVRPLIDFDNKYCTGLVISLIEKTGERTMFGYPGANQNLRKEHLLKVICELPEKIDSVFVDGYAMRLRSTAKNIIWFVQMLKSRYDPTIFMDASLPTLPTQRVYYLDQLIEFSDVLFFNKEEALLYTKSTNVKESLKKFRELVHGDKIIVIKLGSNGALCLDLKTNSVVYAKAFKAKVIDTTGAGDAFNAAFIHMYLKGRNINKALVFANWFAARTIEKYGARTFPSKEQVDRFLLKLNKREISHEI